MSRTINKKRILLEEKLHAQLGTTEELLKEWENDTYPVDGQVISTFWKEIELAENIIIIGDYDVDGICASHILSTGIKHNFPDKKVRIRIPRRFTEGYGINDIIAKEIIEEFPNNSLVITVDNGIVAGNTLKLLKDAGLKVIVTDHHELRDGVSLPEVDMLIDPSVKEIPNPFIGNYWCGAAIAYKLCEPMLSETLSKHLETYAGLATVADCAPLREGNWGLVRRAIQSFRECSAPIALQNLLKAMGKDPKFCNEDYFGYYLGPAFNAPGRLLDKGAIEVLKYLHNATPERCKQLIELNEQRKLIRDTQVKMLQEYIETHGLKNTCPIWVHMPGLHEGVVGILAGELTKIYKRPAIVLTNAQGEENHLKGSARSYGDFDIFKYLSNMSELFVKMGGHMAAAGLTITKENFNIAKTYQISEELFKAEDNKRKPFSISKTDIPNMYKSLNKFRPFGEGNQKPLFDLEIDVYKDNATLIGEKSNHLLIQDKYNKYKIMHFNHTPNTLSNKVCFGMLGVINGDAFRGRETPSFNAEELFDIYDDKEKTK